MVFFRDLAASIIANTPVEQFLLSPPDKAKHLKELSEPMFSDADIKRQQAPRSLKAEEAFRIFRILIRVEKAKGEKGKRQKAKG